MATPQWATVEDEEEEGEYSVMFKKLRDTKAAGAAASVPPLPGSLSEDGKEKQQDQRPLLPEQQGKQEEQEKGEKQEKQARGTKWEDSSDEEEGGEGEGEEAATVEAGREAEVTHVPRLNSTSESYSVMFRVLKDKKISQDKGSTGQQQAQQPGRKKKAKGSKVDAGNGKSSGGDKAVASGPEKQQRHEGQPKGFFGSLKEWFRKLFAS